MAYRSVNPFDGMISQTFDELSDEELEAALGTAAKCYATWRLKTFAERANVVARAATILRTRVDEFANPVTLEMGKLIGQARGEVVLSADILDYYAKNAERFLAPQHLTPQLGQADVESSPIGVLLGIEPWNFPYYQLARFAAPNLMAGNVVMVKHAACVPQCAIAFERLWLDAGAPEGAYTNLMISYDQVNSVIDDPRIKGVALTGSADAGKIIAGRAGQNLKKSTLELGGSDAFIVLEDADLEKTVEWAVWGKMNNTGQCCVAAKRFIVVEQLADRFLEKFKNALAALKPGNPMDEATTLGPLSTEGALIKLLAQVRQARTEGATLVMGGERMDRPGAFMVDAALMGFVLWAALTTLAWIAGLALARRVGRELSIGEQVVNDVLPKDRDIAMVFQNYALYPHMTVAQNVFMGSEPRGRFGTVDATLVYNDQDVTKSTVSASLPSRSGTLFSQRYSHRRAFAPMPVTSVSDGMSAAPDTYS